MAVGRSVRTALRATRRVERVAGASATAGAHFRPMYQERRSLVPGAVVWSRVSTGDEVRVLPDGCMDLMWSPDGGLVIAGPDTVPQLYQSPAGTLLAALRFAPGTAPLALGVPAYVLRDQRVGLADAWPASEVERLEDAIRRSPDPGAVLEGLAQDRLRQRATAADLARLRLIVRELARGSRIPDVAEAAGLSERQLHRRSLQAFGYGPKVLARILRLDRALGRVRAGVAFADAAEDYADQAHLAREVRRLAGASLTQLTR